MCTANRNNVRKSGPTVGRSDSFWMCRCNVPIGPDDDVVGVMLVVLLLLDAVVQSSLLLE